MLSRANEANVKSHLLVFIALLILNIVKDYAQLINAMHYVRSTRNKRIFKKSKIISFSKLFMNHRLV